MEIPDDLFSRINALLNTLSASCSECLRPKTMCSECDLKAVPSILSRLNNRTNPNGIDRVNYGKRFDMYEQEIRNAGRPLLASEIDPRHLLCGRGLKYWSLRKMVKLGILKCFKKNEKNYFSIKD